MSGARRTRRGVERSRKEVDASGRSRANSTNRNSSAGSEFERPAIQLLANGAALVSGLALIADVNERLGLALSDEEYDTIGGYVFGVLGRRPEVGDEVALDGYRAHIEALDGLRIDRLRLVPEPAAEGDART